MSLLQVFDYSTTLVITQFSRNVTYSFLVLSLSITFPLVLILGRLGILGIGWLYG